MKKLVGSIALLALSIPFAAQAADLPPAPAPSYKTPVVVPEVWTWTGCYVGLHAGGAWSNVQITDVGNAAGLAFDTGFPGTTFSPGNNAAFFGGGQAGCQYQAGWFVGGLEGDLGWMDLNQSALEPGNFFGTTVGINSGLYGDITGRLGVAAGPTLFYAKGGWAWYNGTENFSTTPASGFISNSNVSTFNGWVAGAGIEYRFAPNWTAKVEYLHYAFNSQTFNVTAAGVAGGPFPYTIQPTVDSVKVGVNYLFNWGGPVSARY
ncbi:MAG TPA: outer membrane beta-barrel protein [Xanthobacteraceae bacterium]|nr:outer membrane beta-barrel protein [Xanthobacteraceae bacterium]